MTRATGLASGDADQGTLAWRIRQGDAEAEERLAQIFGPRLRAVALARTRDPELARELAQDTLLAVITALRGGQLREVDKLSSFVYGVLRNLLNNNFRSSGRQPRTEPVAPEHALVVPGDPVEDAERTRLVRHALQHLSADDRRIVLFTLVQGLKPAEIARRMGMSDEVVRARKSRALKRIVESVRELSRS